MSTKSRVLQQQRNWATTRSWVPDARGYVERYNLNLFQPLSPGAERAFTAGSGSELMPSSLRPAKMAALHSSSALAVNAFDYWSGKPLAAIASALGLPFVPSKFRFEAQFPTGLPGTPPNLDLAFSCQDGQIVGVESKFTEWLTPKPRGKEPFKPTYFPAAAPLWARAGLAGGQRLAEAMRTGERTFRHLDAAQLLKHMLGLAFAAPGRCSLLYLYLDCPGPEAKVHRAEIDQFAECIDADMPFLTTTYQRFFDNLGAALGEEHRPYLDYVTRRYRFA